MKVGDVLHWRFPRQAQPVEVTLIEQDEDPGWWVARTVRGGKYLVNESELQQLPPPQGDKP